MNEKKNVTVSCGISLPTALFLIFLVLKLVGVIDWSWWWVTAPLWISVGLCIATILISIVVLLIMHAMQVHRVNKLRKRGKRFGNQRFTW